MVSSDSRPDESSRETLIEAILDFLPGQDLLALCEIRAALEQEIDAAGADALLALKARLAADDGWEYYAVSPFSKAMVGCESATPRPRRLSNS